MTALTTGPSVSARDALQAGLCSPSCLPSHAASASCQGAYHGILLRYITAAPPPAGKPNRSARRRLRKGRRA